MFTRSNRLRSSTTAFLLVLSPHLLHEPFPFPFALSQFRQDGVLIICGADGFRFLRDAKGVRISDG